MTHALTLVVFGLSLSSSWGNGHATTYRSLLRGAAEAGHRVLFLERDVPWYAAHRDLPDPDFCRLAYYDGVEDATARFGAEIAEADAVIVGSYVPDGPKLIDALAAARPRLLCFYDIDTPVTLARLERGDEAFLARRQIPLFDVYFSFSGGTVLDELETGYGARRAAALYCSVDADAYRPTGEAPQWDLGYLGTYSPDRQPALERLLIEPARRLPERRFVVAGSQYPDDIAWPANVARIEHLPPGEHASFYSRQRFTLNVTRADMIAAGWSPSVRLFEAAACRTPIISDRWRGLDALLPEGEAVLIADDTADVTAALTALDEPQRRALAEAAHARVMAGHTGRARAEEMAIALRECLDDDRPGRPPGAQAAEAAGKETQW
ncbi:glycosyltransferase [Aquibium sp. A9E412]|uniref:CgeB family protein n=1 Tax=Aquibium sp. A9E412 TaxID=2976767 RepID=UPI0025AF5702|nr:glycosyltransferase [Aquibium sp. A9E412]MDN2564903.1 glycosyltransferase [Aquibium sp. A9E412]